MDKKKKVVEDEGEPEGKSNANVCLVCDTT